MKREHEPSVSELVEAWARSKGLAVPPPRGPTAPAWGKLYRQWHAATFPKSPYRKRKGKR